jgi:tetratricopeptide (TPR) repeat protein
MRRGQDQMDIYADNSKYDDSNIRALNLLSSDRLDGAAIMVDREIEKVPDCWEAWAAKADILYFQKEYAAALECCDIALRLNPDNALAWNTKGNAMYRLDRYEEAITCYNRAIESEPLFIRAWYNKRLALEVQLKKSNSKISIKKCR